MGFATARYAGRSTSTARCATRWTTCASSCARCARGVSARRRAPRRACRSCNASSPVPRRALPRRMPPPPRRSSSRCNRRPSPRNSMRSSPIRGIAAPWTTHSPARAPCAGSPASATFRRWPMSPTRSIAPRGPSCPTRRWRRPTWSSFAPPRRCCARPRRACARDAPPIRGRRRWRASPTPFRHSPPTRRRPPTRLPWSASTNSSTPTRGPTSSSGRRRRRRRVRSAFATRWSLVPSTCADWWPTRVPCATRRARRAPSACCVMRCWSCSRWRHRSTCTRWRRSSGRRRARIRCSRRRSSTPSTAAPSCSSPRASRWTRSNAGWRCSNARDGQRPSSPRPS